MKPIYLDYNATTPLDPRVVEAMLPYLKEHFGNPSSVHHFGEEAKRAVEKARGQVASLLGCKPEEVIFTSGGSESNNFALKGIAQTLKNKGKHIITTKIEHPAILNPCRFLEQIGFSVTYLPVDSYGLLAPSDVEDAVSSETILISIMHANNEIGTIEPIEEIGRIARNRRVYFHTDAAQSVGKIATKVEELNVDLLSIAGHKLHAPKGIGALYIRENVEIEPLIHGAGHEFGKRAGTENVASIVALGAACEIAENEMKTYSVKILELRGKLHQGILDITNKVVLNGHLDKRLPNTLNVSFLGYTGSEVLARLKGVAASTGAACHDRSVKLSDTLEAIGADEERGRGAVRFSLGKYTTEDEINQVISMLRNVLRSD